MREKHLLNLFREFNNLLVVGSLPIKHRRYCIGLVHPMCWPGANYRHVLCSQTHRSLKEEKGSLFFMATIYTITLAGNILSVLSNSPNGVIFDSLVSGTHYQVNLPIADAQAFVSGLGRFLATVGTSAPLYGMVNLPLSPNILPTLYNTATTGTVSLQPIAQPSLGYQAPAGLVITVQTPTLTTSYTLQFSDVQSLVASLSHFNSTWQ